MSTFDSILNRVDQIAKIAGWDEKEIEVLSKHKRISKAKIKANGQEYDAWRIVHSDALGPGKGGIRYHPNVSEDEVKSLSFWMSLKNSLAGLPYGGGKGGVIVDPKKKTKAELEAISRAYIRAFSKVVGQDIDIPAPDVYTNSEVMSWMLDEYESIVGYHQPGMITGKPVELGGLSLRTDSTAKGGYIIFNELVGSIKKADGKPTIAIQGFGNAGNNFAKMVYEDGYKVVAVSDSKGGIYNQDGLDISKVLEAKESKGNVAAFKKAKVISNEQLLELDVDVLVLAALENQITKSNAKKIRAKFIIELANGPVDPEADKILFSNKVTVVPDILANAGGVVVSYFEWAQNRAGNILDEEYLRNKLEVIMKSAWQRVEATYNEHKGKIDLRTAAYIIAIKRILTAEKYRGNL